MVAGLDCRSLCHSHSCRRGVQCERAILCNEVPGYQETGGWCSGPGSCDIDGTCKSCDDGKWPHVFHKSSCWAHAQL
jgi:hypothetical protein